MDGYFKLCCLCYFKLCRGSLLLLENNCVHRDSNTSAHGSQHGEGNLKLLVLHPVQVVHVLCMDVVWLIMRCVLPSASLQWNEIHEKLGETTMGQISKTKAARITQPHGKTKLHDKFDNMETSRV